MDPRKTVNHKIRTLGLSRSLLARLAGSSIYRSDLSSWLNGHSNLSEPKAARLVAVVDGVERALKVFGEAYPGLRLDLKDPEFIARLVRAVETAEREHRLADLKATTEALIANFRVVIH